MKPDVKASAGLVPIPHAERPGPRGAVADDPDLADLADMPVSAEPAWQSLFRPQVALAIMAGALLLGVLEALQVYTGTAAVGRPIELSRALTSTLPSWILWAMGLPLVWWFGDRYRIEKGRMAGALLTHAPISALFAVAHLTGSAFLSDVVLHGEPLPVPFVDHVTRLFSIYFMVALSAYWAMLGAFYAVDYSRKFRERERVASDLALRASRLEASLAQASLEALRAQLNPHFLFNALNTASVLALQGERKEVARMLARLSDLLRLSLENSRQFVSLEEEFRILDCYLAIEETRFRDRLTVERSLPDHVRGAAVPSLLLQPIVENAVRHGISRAPGPGRIRIAADRRGGRLVIEVTDTGPGFSTPEPVGCGVGLANTRARLEQLFGRRQRLTLDNQPEGGAVVRIELPFRPFNAGTGAAANGASPAPEPFRSH
jgi:two-component system, LytTR family, sensor kinase